MMSTTTPTQQSPPPQPNIGSSSYIYLSAEHLFTPSGLLILLAMISVFIGFFVALSDMSGIAIFFKTIAMVEFCLTALLMILFLFHVPDVYINVNWLSFEFFFSTGFAILLAVASAILVFSGSTKLFVAACFGFAAMFAYGYNAFLKYRQYTTSPPSVVA